MVWIWAIIPGMLIWFSILLAPWRPARNRESLDSAVAGQDMDLSDVTVLIPARNEAATIATTLRALATQGHGLRVVVVDDQSVDGTAEVARRALVTDQPLDLEIISGTTLPTGWAGKLWALEQGWPHVKTPLLLLLDADIELQPGILAKLLEKRREDNRQFLSLMAVLPMETFLEKLLLPAFVYFFKLIYPFHLSNDPRYPWMAAAAGGCILLETRILHELGGFRTLRAALIDDCTLASRVKGRGYRTWIGLSHSLRSLRRYDGIKPIWNMVARSAFTQLRYSVTALLGVTVLFVAGFWLPFAGLFFPGTGVRVIAAMALGAMLLSYIPTLTYYGLGRRWAMAMPVIGTLYLAMTWSSAVRYWRGRGFAWKGRAYLQEGEESNGHCLR